MSDRYDNQFLLWYFFSGEDSGAGQTMQTAVQEVNTDYQDRLDEIKASHSYDVLEMSGSRAVWKEVLAVYAVKTTTDPDTAQEVAIMDHTKKQLLKDIFWQMNEISSSTDTKIETVIETSDDGNGNIVETETTVTQTYLYITVSHKTAEEEDLIWNNCQFADKFVKNVITGLLPFIFYTIYKPFADPNLVCQSFNSNICFCTGGFIISPSVS